MATGKRFYWIKLKESFLTSDTVDFFMSQPGGANYVVLYQMLCLKTINTGGRLERKIGEVLIPYDVDKIQRDTKWFSADTVRVALELYTRFGLVYRDESGTLVMTDHENLVGSETDWSEKKRRQRGMLLNSGDNVPELSPQILDIKSIDNRERDNNSGGGNRKGGMGGNEPPPPPDEDYSEYDPLVAYAADNLLGMNADNAEELVSYREHMTDDMIRWAINDTLGSGSRAYKYTRAILNRIVECGFKTLAEVKAAEEKRRAQKEAQKAEVQKPGKGKPMNSRTVTEEECEGLFADIMNRKRSEGGAQE